MAHNPLLEVRYGAHEMRDVQNIADILVDPKGALLYRRKRTCAEPANPPNSTTWIASCSPKGLDQLPADYPSAGFTRHA